MLRVLNLTVTSMAGTIRIEDPDDNIPLFGPDPDDEPLFGPTTPHNISVQLFSPKFTTFFSK